MPGHATAASVHRQRDCRSHRTDLWRRLVADATGGANRLVAATCGGIDLACLSSGRPRENQRGWKVRASCSTLEPPELVQKLPAPCSAGLEPATSPLLPPHPTAPCSLAVALCMSPPRPALLQCPLAPCGWRRGHRPPRATPCRRGVVPRAPGPGPPPSRSAAPHRHQPAPRAELPPDSTGRRSGPLQDARRLAPSAVQCLAVWLSGSSSWGLGGLRGAGPRANWCAEPPPLPLAQN